MGVNMPALTFHEAAYVIGRGLSIGLFDLKEVIAWADRRIGEMAEPPFWLLELATMSPRSSFDAGQIVLPYVPQVPPPKPAGVILALIPAVASVADEELRGYAKLVYEIMYAISDEWDEVVAKTNQIDDEFALWEDGIIESDITAFRRDMEGFWDKYSLPEEAKSLFPIRCRVFY